MEWVYYEHGRVDHSLHATRDFGSLRDSLEALTKTNISSSVALVIVTAPLGTNWSKFETKAIADPFTSPTVILCWITKDF